jgi:hypothetical protein
MINYFGHHDSRLPVILETVRQHNGLIVEDFTHNLFTDLFYGDIALCSFRKTLESPFGALMLDPGKLVRVEATPYSRCEYLKLMARQLLAMFMKRCRLSKPVYRQLFVENESCLDRLSVTDDWVNRWFFNRLFRPEIKRIRRDNYRYLAERLGSLRLLSDDDLYFTMPIVLPDRSTRDRLRQELIRWRIYCPVHWETESHPLSERILSLPIDQRYRLTEMEIIVKSIERFFHEGRYAKRNAQVGIDLATDDSGSPPERQNPLSALF